MDQQTLLGLQRGDVDERLQRGEHGERECRSRLVGDRVGSAHEFARRNYRVLGVGGALLREPGHPDDTVPDRERLRRVVCGPGKGGTDGVDRAR